MPKGWRYYNNDNNNIIVIVIVAVLLRMIIRLINTDSSAYTGTIKMSPIRNFCSWNFKPTTLSTPQDNIKRNNKVKLIFTSQATCNEDHHMRKYEHKHSIKYHVNGITRTLNNQRECEKWNEPQADYKQLGARQ